MKAFKYSEFGTGEIYLECDGCLTTRISPLSASCPACGRRFKTVVDEVELTKEHNAVILEMNSAALVGDEVGRKRAEKKCIELGMQRFLLEN